MAAEAQNQFSDQDDSFEASFARANALLYQDTSLARDILTKLGQGLTDQERAERARVQERLSIAERILGDFCKARTLAAGAESDYRSEKDLIGVSRALISAGNIDWSTGDHQAALGHYEAAYHIRREFDDSASTAGALASIANIYSEMGRLEDAQERYEQVLFLAHKARDQRIIARTENNLAECLLLLGKAEAALNHARSALKTCRQIEDVSEEPNVLINLGQILAKIELWDEALAALDEAIKTAGEIGDQRTVAEAMMHHSVVLELQPGVTMERRLEADHRRVEAIEIAKEIGAIGLQRRLLEAHAQSAMLRGEFRLADVIQYQADTLPES